MIPLIVMAAASILANKQKQSQEKKQLYLQQLEKNAQRMGGNTDLAEIYSGENAINQQSADYGSALGLVGKFGDSVSGSDYASDPGKGFSNGGYEQGGVEYAPEKSIGGDDDNRLIDPFKDHGSYRSGDYVLPNPYVDKSDYVLDPWKDGEGAISPYDAARRYRR